VNAPSQTVYPWDRRKKIENPFILLREFTSFLGRRLPWSATERHVALIIAAHMGKIGDDGRHMSFPGVSRIANEMDVAEKTVKRALTIVTRDEARSNATAVFEVERRAGSLGRNQYYLRPGRLNEVADYLHAIENSARQGHAEGGNGHDDPFPGVTARTQARIVADESSGTTPSLTSPIRKTPVHAARALAAGPFPPEEKARFTRRAPGWRKLTRLARVDGQRPSRDSKGRWQIELEDCPSCSAGIARFALAENGVVLGQCFGKDGQSGCDGVAIAEALGIHASDLFPRLKRRRR
jgi:hypothetical protein